MGVLILSCVFLFGCESSPTKEHPWSRVTPLEPEWIRNGEPIIFEGETWYPADSIENLLDSEVYLMGEYNGTQLFVEYTDVRPYDRIYTKFAKNKFRFFEKKKE